MGRKKKSPIDLVITVVGLGLYFVVFLMFRFEWSLSKTALILLFLALSAIKIVSDLRSKVGLREKIFSITIMGIAFIVFSGVLLFVV